MGSFEISMILTGAAGLLIAILGFVMMATGRGSFLISGYNTMKKEEKEKYDAKAITKFVGKFLLVIGFLTVLLAGATTLGVLYNTSIIWISGIAFTLIVTVYSIYLVICLNTGNRFRK